MKLLMALKYQKTKGHQMRHFLVTTLLSLTASFAIAKDVIPNSGLKHGASYVRVTKPFEDKVSFESCIFGYEKSTCEFLGNNKYYSVKALTKQKTTESWQVAGSVALDIGLILATVGTAGYVGAATGALIYGTGTAGTTGLIIGTSAGVVGNAALITLVDAMNPYEQYKQSQTIHADVVNDNKVPVTNIEDFIERLDLVLSKM